MSDGGAPLNTEISPVDRQLTQIGHEGLHKRRLHISVHRSLVRKRLDEVQDRFVIGIDSHDARPSQSFDIWAQLDHTLGKLGLLARPCLEPDIDMNCLGHRLSVGPSDGSDDRTNITAESHPFPLGHRLYEWSHIWNRREPRRHSSATTRRVAHRRITRDDNEERK